MQNPDLYLTARKPDNKEFVLDVKLERSFKNYFLLHKEKSSTLLTHAFQKLRKLNIEPVEYNVT